MNVAIIPARGGSKGIEGKNIVPLLGTPLIGYTIEQAKASETVDAVYVSTDDEDIAATSREFGATVIDRPAPLADDHASTESALLHTVEYLQDEGEMFEYVTLLQCTSPLRREDDIDRTVELVTEGRYDSALSCCADHSFYWKRGTESAAPINYDPQHRKRRQDQESRYEENGSIYVIERELLQSTECRLAGQVGIHEMPRMLSFEIDTPEDLKIVESVAEHADFYSGEC